MSLWVAIALFFVFDAILVALVLQRIHRRHREAREAQARTAPASPHRVVSAPRPDYEQRRGVSPGLGFGLILLAALAAGVVLWERSEPVAEPARVPVEQRPVSPVSPAPGATPTASLRPGAAAGGGTITLSLARDLRLVPWRQPAQSSTRMHALESERPRAVRRAPRARNLEYGKLVLGPRRHEVHFAVSSAGGRGGTKLWIDRNGDGDLTNDGKPAASEQEKIGASLRVPVAALYGDDHDDGAFDVWLFRNARKGARGWASHYSRTQAQGSVELGRQRYDVRIVDQDENDADLRNDGVYVDLNGDGELSREQEYAPPGGSLWVDGRAWRFEVTL